MGLFKKTTSEPKTTDRRPFWEPLEGRQMFTGVPTAMPGFFTLPASVAAKPAAVASAARPAAFDPVAPPLTATPSSLVAGSFTPLYGHDLQQVASSRMPDGRNISFALGGDGAVYYRMQSSPNSTSWNPWEWLRGDVASIAVTQGVGGRVHVLAMGLDHSAYEIGQTAANSDSWTSWQGLGGWQLQQLAVGQNADGRAELFAVGGDAVIYHKWQNAAGYWSGWVGLGGSVQSISLARGVNGCLNCIGLKLDGTVGFVGQTSPNGQWGGWTDLQGLGLGNGAKFRQIAASQDADGRSEFFALGTDNAVYHKWQHYDASWSGWQSLGGNVRSIAAGLDGGRLQALAIGWDSQIYVNGQTSDNGNFGGWSDWGGSVRQIAVGADGNGGIRVLSLNSDLSASYGGPSATVDDAVSVVSRYGNELVVTANGPGVTVSVSQVGSVLDITADGAVTLDPVPAGGLFVYTRTGNDTVMIDPSVSARTTVETIDNAPSTVLSFGTSVITWADSTDAVTGVAAPNLHKVGSFWDGVSKAAGASLANPTNPAMNKYTQSNGTTLVYDSGTSFTPVQTSLFGTGPVIGDINQQDLGDCYFMATVSAVAQQRPDLIRNSAVDMGDGTFTVVYYDQGTPVYVRVDGAFEKSIYNSYDYAKPGPNGTLWGPVMEKAFAEYRDWDRSYAHVNAGGEPNEVFQDLNLKTNYFVPANNTDSALNQRFAADLANGRAVTLCTNNATSSKSELCSGGLVGNHCYVLTGLKQVNGVNMYVVRNPWGNKPAESKLEDSTGVATLTFSQMCGNFYGGYDMA